MTAPVARSIREERRLVTCMFVDVVGSTEMTMKLGAERLKHELGAAFTELSGIITAHGGTVEKYIGDAIYALFGAPIAHEDDPLRALRAAEALRQWATTGSFAVRVGVETGEAVVDLEAASNTRQQMSVGPVVNIAARLQQRAEPGEVLVGPTAREATAGVAELEPVADAELKGIGRVAVWRLVRVGTPPIQQLPFVGREAELGLLALAYQRARKGRSVLAVVSGPAGQGKTRLVQEFLQGRANGAQVIPTRCRPAAEVGVFAPVRQLLGVTALDALTDLVSRVCTDDVECERVIAGLAESAGIATSASLTRLPAAEREDEIVQAWRRYLAVLGAERLVILAIDDIHWADPSLVRLVDRLTFGGPRLLVIATARPEFAEAAGVRPSGDRFFIELEGLEPGEARQLAAEAGRDDDRVIERAEGNPLFLVELARARIEGELPLTLQGALGARLDELGPDDRALLAAASVAGERFTAEDAAFLARRDIADVGRALGHLADLHFLDQSDEDYRFHHGLVRDVAYGRLLAVERMHAHARYAKERVHVEDVAALAYHWWEALRPPDAEWVWADDPDLPAMRRDAFHAHLAVGQTHIEHFAVDRAIELLDRALSFAAGDREQAETEQALGIAYRRVLRQDESWAHLRRSLELFRATGDVPVRAYAELVNSAQFTGAFKVRPAWKEVAAIADEGAAAARRVGDLGSLARILRSHGQGLQNANEGDPAYSEQLLADAVEAAERSGDPVVRRQTLMSRAGTLMMRARPAEARPLLDDVERSMAGADAAERMNFSRVQAGVHLQVGELEASGSAALQAVELAGPMGPHQKTHAWNDLAKVYKARADWPRLVELAHRAADLIATEKASAFCTNGAEILESGAIAHALAGEREESLRLLRLIPGTDVEPDLVTGVPRALLGFSSPETDAKLREDRWIWWEWERAAFRAIILGRPDDAEKALEKMGPVSETAPLYRAFAESVREAVRELRGGPAATYKALRDIGFVGWIEILKRRVNAEY
jgi:class 3 adenylate cyclase/tetratricopeptide (TPR) repeat protein